MQLIHRASGITGFMRMVGCVPSPERTSLGPFSLLTGKLTGKNSKNSGFTEDTVSFAQLYQWVERYFPKEITGKYSKRAGNELFGTGTCRRGLPGRSIPEFSATNSPSILKPMAQYPHGVFPKRTSWKTDQIHSMVSDACRSTEVQIYLQKDISNLVEQDLRPKLSQQIHQ